MSENKIFKPTILWEKFYDPFADNTSAEWPGHNAKNIVEEYKDSYSEDDDDDDDKPVKNKVVQSRFIMTQLGPIPLTEYTMPSKIFNFWTAHTNFSITDGIREIVEKTNGVETLDIFTRYRMRIGFGKAFESAAVKMEIQDKVNDYFKKD